MDERLKEVKRYSSGKNLNERWYENVIIRYLEERHGYMHLFGPNIVRTSAKYQDVFLPKVFEEAVLRINPNLPKQAVEAVTQKIVEVEQGSLEQQNQIFMDYLQSGVEVHYFDGFKICYDLVQLLDFDNPENNDFYIVNQWKFVQYSEKRPDLIIFVNGMPLVIFELKSPSREETDVSEAYLQLRNYMKHIPALFIPNVFCMISDMAETRVGTITANEDRYVEWKSYNGESIDDQGKWQTMIDGMLPKARLLDIIQNFICFNDSSNEIRKILAAYHQYFGVKKAIERTKRALQGNGKIGVFWHTQDSGKSLSMVFFTHLLQSTLESPTIVVITDRNDLDNQLYEQFCRCSKFLRQEPIQAGSQEDLRKLLFGRAANGIIFTTLQKFTDGSGPLCDRKNVVVIVDEAHRSHYGLEEKIGADGRVSVGVARLVRKALPNASYIGFTGTPISFEDRNTREVFGDYIDVYDMTQAVADGATTPIYYESRVINLNLDVEMLERLDEAYQQFADQTNEITAEKAKRDLGNLDSILGTAQTIDSLCRDIIEHYEKNRAEILSGKAMIVAYSRQMAIKIYRRIIELRPTWIDKICVVMTTSNQDPEDWFAICGGSTHKKEMERKFKDDEDPLKIAIVVDMWLTGFDVPGLSTMYVFKPMRGANLMQAIARVNRVCRHKEGGLIIDYIGVANALKRAMRDYTVRDQQSYGNMNIADTAYPKFLEKLDVCRDLLHGFDYRKRIFSLDNLVIAETLRDGVNWLLDRERVEDRKNFVQQAQLMIQASTLCKSMLSSEEQRESSFFHALRTQVVRLKNATFNNENISGQRMSYIQFNEQISEIVQQAVQSDGIINLFSTAVDSVGISLFDEAFLAEISKMKEKNIAVEALKRLLMEQVKLYKRTSVVLGNKFSEMLHRALNAYMNGMLTNVEVIEELLKMAREMMQERADARKMGLSEEEMAFYDAFTRPEAVKDFCNNDELVQMTRELTESLQSSVTIDWQRKESARAGMRRMIRRLLKKYKYPPEGINDAMGIVIEQCELWADVNVSEETNR